MAEQVYEMTYEGIKELQDELEERKTQRAAEIATRLKEARALGDLSENSEFDDAVAAKEENDVRIMEIENILKNAKVIEQKKISKTRVSLGGQVVICDEETGEEETYVLVSAKEADIFAGKISNESPVGAAIQGKQKGDVVEVKTPSGMLRYRIVKIDRPKGES